MCWGCSFEGAIDISLLPLHIGTMYISTSLPTHRPIQEIKLAATWIHFLNGYPWAAQELGDSAQPVSMCVVQQTWHVHTDVTQLNSLITKLLPFLLIFTLTPCSGALLEKLTCIKVDKKFRVFCGPRRFITAFTRARHLSLSRARPI